MTRCMGDVLRMSAERSRARAKAADPAKVIERSPFKIIILETHLLG